MSSSPLRLGVVGLGRAFSLMLPTFVADPRVQLAAASDPREQARAQFSLDFGSPVYATVEELSADPAVEAIYIASPHQFHADHTRIAADRGKHVLVEKPIALSLEESDAMIDACRAANVCLIVGHCHSFDSPYLEARKIISAGEVGRVRMILALNYTDFLYRLRRPEELATEQGGGVVFNQAAHQVDVVRLLAGSRAVKVRAVSGAWDPARPTEGAYVALLWFEDGTFASLTYSGYAHFDSDEWCGNVSEMGWPKDVAQYGLARRRLGDIASEAEEAALKAAGAYGGTAYTNVDQSDGRADTRLHQHFGPVVISCEHADLRPVPDGVWVYGDERREKWPLPPPRVPRFEVIDELIAAVRNGQPPVHDGRWGKATLEICVAILRSAAEQRDVVLHHQVDVGS